jgi:hypothetical protein
VFTLRFSTAPTQQTVCGCVHQPTQILEVQKEWDHSFQKAAQFDADHWFIVIHISHQVAALLADTPPSGEAYGELKAAITDHIRYVRAIVVESVPEAGRRARRQHRCRNANERMGKAL